MFSLIVGLLSVAATTAIGVAQYKQQKGAMAESKKLYGRERRIGLEQQASENELAEERLGLNARKLNFEKKMFGEYKKDKQSQADYDINKATRDTLTQSARNIVKPEEGFLFKSRLTGRYA